LPTETDAYGAAGDAEKTKERRVRVSLFQQVVVLSKNIVVMAIDEPEEGTLRHISLTQLATGTELTIVGEGFTSRTVRHAATIARILFFCEISKHLIPVSTFRRN
jgi:hypothetical protein